MCVACTVIFRRHYLKGGQDKNEIKFKKNKSQHLKADILIDWLLPSFYPYFCVVPRALGCRGYIVYV